MVDPGQERLRYDASQVVATYLNNSPLHDVAVLRNHAPPDEKKAEKIRERMDLLGTPLNYETAASLYASLLEVAESARACSYYSVRSNFVPLGTETLRLWLYIFSCTYQIWCTSVLRELGLHLSMYSNVLQIHSSVFEHIYYM